DCENETGNVTGVLGTYIAPSTLSGHTEHVIWSQPSTLSDRTEHVIWSHPARYLIAPSTLSDHAKHLV
ncbi:MAG TPA: hypothetical protein VKB36_00775, partial [Vicinamibacterales bacterium]|nr:hypothetical protein [Vicinamibacterales bacterium]